MKFDQMFVTEQIDAAETIEEAESAEQRYAYLSHAPFFSI